MRDTPVMPAADYESGHCALQLAASVLWYPSTTDAIVEGAFIDSRHVLIGRTMRFSILDVFFRVSTRRLEIGKPCFEAHAINNTSRENLLLRPSSWQPSLLFGDLRLQILSSKNSNKNRWMLNVYQEFTNDDSSISPASR